MSDQCSTILANGVFDTTIINTSQQVHLIWEKWWYSQEASEAKENVDAGIGLPIGDFLVGGSFDSNSFNSWKQTVAGKFSGDSFSSSDVNILLNHASPAILKAYNDCVAITNQGLSIFDVATDLASGIIVLYIKYNPSGNTPDRPKVQGSSMVNAQLANPIAGLTPTEFVRTGSELPFGTLPVTVKVQDLSKMAVFDLYTDMGNPSHNILLGLPKRPPSSFEIEAKSFIKSQNIEVGVLDYGADVIHNASPYGPQPNMAEYQISLNFDSNPIANYKLEIHYAADDSRPVEVYCNDKLVNNNALGVKTGGWYPPNQIWANVGIASFRSGINLLRISRQNVFPHIQKLKLTLVD
jgi:hypothetical protein